MSRLEEARSRYESITLPLAFTATEDAVRFFREDVPWLFGRVEELERENERLRAEVEHVKESASMGLSKWREMVAVVPGWFESAAQGFDEDSNRLDD